MKPPVKKHNKIPARLSTGAMAFAMLPAALASGGPSDDEVLKPISMFDSSRAGDLVKEGNELFKFGKFHEAGDKYDKASLNNLNWFAPWTNGALTARRLGNLGAARRADNEAFMLGDRTPRGKTISAEIDTARGQTERARADLNDALFEGPNDPFTLLGLARLDLESAQIRQAERYMWQAYRGGKSIVLDSDLSTHKPSVTGYLGADREAEVSADFQTYSSQLSSVGNGSYLEQEVGSANALQQAAKLDVSVDTGIGIVAGQYRHLESERPGATIADPFLPSTPGSKLDFSHAMLGFQRRDGDFTFHLNYRNEQSDLRATSTSPFLRDNLIDQWILEGRYDSGPWMAGIGYSLVDKNAATATPAIEPLEALFPQGTNGYLVRRDEVGNDIHVTSGATISTAGGVTNVSVTAELGVRLIGTRFARVGVRPGINRVGTNLGPVSAFDEDTSSNPIDRQFLAANEFNRGTSLPELNARESTTYLSIPLLDARRTTLNLVGSLRQFANFDFIGADPQTSSKLTLSPVDSGRVIRSGFEMATVVNRSLNGSLSAAYQSSSANYRLPTVDGNGNVSNDSALPSVSHLEAKAALDWSLPNSTLGLSLNVVSSRLQALPTSGPIGPATMLRRESSAIGFDAHFSTNFGGGTLNLTLLNLAGGSFYRGYGGSRSVFIGYGRKL